MILFILCSKYFNKKITLLHNISERQRSSRYSPSDHRRSSRERSRSRINDLRYHDDNNRHGSRNRSRDRERSKTRDDRIDRRSRDSHVSYRHGHGGHGLHGTSHGHDRHRSHRDRSRDRRKGGDGRSRHEKADKFKDSLSEGQKKAASSDSDVEVEIDINEDDEDEEAIIERRRKQREELLKVKFFKAYSMKIYLFTGFTNITETISEILIPIRVIIRRIMKIFIYIYTNHIKYYFTFVFIRDWVKAKNPLSNRNRKYPNQ